ncbi:PaaI family thioesterase [Mumia sp. ZJ1417]|uniref:PaaI family thioesterase n=1 Tax=Mumia sp. ZJ1417 TaxID=2708082 RepID=UPI0014200AAB|nr:PaaI family thioesterase [Mumia sp. ZJ1417]QMW65474.1 PaaI family thioesterase [Mumia sp. ZJ1417]
MTAPPTDRTGAEAATRERTHTWDDPMATVHAAAGRSGLELMRAVRDGLVPSAPIARLVGFALTSVEEGEVEFTLEPAEFQYNPIGSVHGGVFATLLDSAAGCAVHTTLPEGVGYTSQDLNVKFLRRLTVETGPVRAVGRVRHRGRTTALAEAELLDADGRLLAHATSSCLILAAG